MAAPMKLRELSGNSLHSKRESAYKTSVFDNISQIEYQQFFLEYLVPNKPCIFDQSVTKHWRSRRNWVTADRKPNLDFLRKNFGGAVVPVADCKQEQYSAHPKEDLTLSEYLDYWEDYQAKGYPKELPCLYLKDWHFTKAFPDYEAYATPVYFQSDWLNEFWDTLPQDDYRFVYMGPKGTWTPFHSDVYRSFSWSANICGKKKWIFYPPGCEENLKDKLGNLVYDVTSEALENGTDYPNSAKVKGQKLEVIQGEGQIIFVPSGWHHQVYNLEDTISINHNWLNGCNIDICWRHLQDNLESVKHEIRDLINMDGWSEQCQLILNASAGINYEKFIQMLKVIVRNRLDKRTKENTVKTDELNTNNQRHVIDNLLQVQIENTLEIDCDSSRKISDKEVYITDFHDRHVEVKFRADHIGDSKTKSKSKLHESCDSVGTVLESKSSESCVENVRKVSAPKIHDNDHDGVLKTKSVSKLHASCDSIDTVRETKCPEISFENDNTISSLKIFDNENTELESKPTVINVEYSKTTSGTCLVKKNPFLSDQSNVKASVSGYEKDVQNNDDYDSSRKNFEEVLNEKFCDSDLRNSRIKTVWESEDYIIYDLYRIKDTLVGIIVDEDYKDLSLGEENSAEYVLEMINSHKAL